MHAIESGLQQRLGADVRVTVRVVDAIEPEASGKHRYVVSHVPLQGELSQATAIH
jgi:phenylacetate-CoA ligase